MLAKVDMVYDVMLKQIEHAFDFGLEGANLSGVRVTAPSKKEWDGAEMKTFRVEKADEIEGPWETVFAGVATVLSAVGTSRAPHFTSTGVL